MDEREVMKMPYIESETYVERANAIHDVIQKELEDYVLIKGDVVE